MSSQVHDLANTLLAQVDAVEKQHPPAESAQRTPSIARPRPGLSHRSGPEAGGAIALPRLQRAKITEAMSLIERESAVIDAVTTRLERLRVEE
jgi:nucleoporin NUP82